MPDEPSIPVSDILSSVSALSLQELFSHDPEEYNQLLASQNLGTVADAVILAMREHRARLEAAEAAGKKPRQTKIITPSTPTASKADFGL